MTITTTELDRVAQAARFTSVEAVRLHLRRVIERINQQGDRVIGYMDAGRTHDDYTQVVQQISVLIGEALTLAAQLDVLASIARTARDHHRAALSGPTGRTNTMGYLNPHTHDLDTPPRPRVVVLCGSTRFKADFERVNRSLTLGGHIVLAPGVFGHADGIELSDASKEALDALHFRKIDLADEVIVVNPGGYIGDSTRREIAYAERSGKPVGYMEGAQRA